jgi:DNA-binding MarR family transcriptional regulator
MPHSKKSSASSLTALSLAVFRVHGALLARGDELVRPYGLTSSRWQVLGALVLSGGRLTVPGVARAMGLTRQAVQKQVDLMKREGLVQSIENPAHERSQLLELTPQGLRTYAKADQRWTLEAHRLAQKHSVGDLERARELLEELAAALRGASAEKGELSR